MSASASFLRRILLSAVPWLLLCATLAVAAPVLAADDVEELPLKTDIVSATVYGRQAQIVRRGEVRLEPGTVQFVCGDLPEKFVESSLSVEGTGVEGARIIGIDLRRTQTSGTESPRYEELSTELEGLEASLERLQIRHSALGRRKELARSISQFSSELGQEQLAAGDFAPSYWDGVLAFFEKENVGTADRMEELEAEMSGLETRRSWIRAELRAMQIGEGPGKEVVVDCETDEGGALTVELTYLVPDASWYPEYTVRYIERDDEVELTYAARIVQATGEDWKGVSAVLSTATPHVGAAPPELIPLYVGGTTGSIRGRVTAASSGMALRYANVSVVGTASGSVTNADGVYVISDVSAGSHTLQASYMGYQTARKSGVRVGVGRVSHVEFALEEEYLAAEEVQLTASRRSSDALAVQPGVVTEGEIHVRGSRASEVKLYAEPPSIPHVEAELLGSEFAANLVIPKPIDLETGAEPRRSLVVRRRIPGSFVLQAVPRLSGHVFVKGTLENPLAIPLLPGAAEMYVETVPEGSNAKVSNFVGEDRIDAVGSGEEFEMYLGVDQNVKVEHSLKRKETLSRESSKTTKVRYTYLITAESFRRGATELRVADRVPVSTIKEVKITDLEIVPEPDEQTEEGMVSWLLHMEHGEKQEITVEYVVEYPSHMSATSLGLEE
ncbi:MAG: mucoidy inhibitor MuiA family protein [Candidatus Eisenbacteria bacterium]